MTIGNSASASIFQLSLIVVCLVFLAPINPIRSFQETHTFTCQALGGLNSTFEWRFNGSVLADANITSTSLQSTLTISNVTASDGGEYTCIVSNLAGNNFASSTMYVHPYIVTNPAEILTAIHGTPGLELECVAQAFPSPTYSWTQLTGPLGPMTVADDSGTGILKFFPVLFFDDLGTYVCTASSNGLMMNSSVSTVYGKPTYVHPPGNSANNVIACYYISAIETTI